MKKKIYIIIGITLFIVAAIFATREIIKNIQDKPIEEKVKTAVENLSDEAKKALNYDELLEDIKAMENGKELVYANEKVIEHFDDSWVSIPASYPDDKHLKGKGYNYKCHRYDDKLFCKFYSTIDNKTIYEKKYSWYGDRYLDKTKPYETVAIVVVIIGLISCIIVYIKNKKEQSK